MTITFRLVALPIRVGTSEETIGMLKGSKVLHRSRINKIGGMLQTTTVACITDTTTVVLRLLHLLVLAGKQEEGS